MNVRLLATLACLQIGAHDSSESRPGVHADPAADVCSGLERLPVYVADPKLCVYVFAKNLAAARQFAFASNGDLFVNNGKVSVLWDANHDGASGDDERGVFAKAPGLNHGLAFIRD